MENNIVSYAYFLGNVLANQNLSGAPDKPATQLCTVLRVSVLRKVCLRVLLSQVLTHNSHSTSGPTRLG